MGYIVPVVSNIHVLLLLLCQCYGDVYIFNTVAATTWFMLLPIFGAFLCR
jgi:hypothetical protein